MNWIVFENNGFLVSHHGFYSCNLVHARDLQEAGLLVVQDKSGWF